MLFLFIQRPLFSKGDIGIVIKFLKFQKLLPPFVKIKEKKGKKAKGFDFEANSIKLISKWLFQYSWPCPQDLTEIQKKTNFSRKLWDIFYVKSKILTSWKVILHISAQLVILRYRSQFGLIYGLQFRDVLPLNYRSRSGLNFTYLITSENSVTQNFKKI